MRVLMFEELIAWQKAQDMAVEIYGTFKELRDWGFRDQICRASVSVSNNIAEGFNRKSNKEFIRFLYISLGSASEVKSMLYLANRLNFIDIKTMNLLLPKITEVSKLITGLIKSLH